METRTPEIIDVTPFNNNFPKKKIDKKAAILSVSIALSFLAVISYFINIGLLHDIGATITILACGYSIYNLNKVVK